jgi:hypothetical protein
MRLANRREVFLPWKWPPETVVRQFLPRCGGQSVAVFAIFDLRSSIRDSRFTIVDSRLPISRFLIPRLPIDDSRFPDSRSQIGD